MKPKYKIGDVLINRYYPKEPAEIVEVTEKSYYIRPLAEKHYRTIEWGIEIFDKKSEVSVKQMPNDILKDLCSK